MLENYFSRPSTLNRLRSGPSGSDVEDLATALQQQGYAWDSIRNYLRGCDQFARWLSQHGYAPSDVSHTRQPLHQRMPRPPSCPNMPRGCPIYSSSGARNCVCPSASRPASYGGRPLVASIRAVLGSGLRPRRQHSSSLSASGEAFRWRPVLGPDECHPYTRSRSLTSGETATQTRRGATASKYRRPIRSALPGVQRRSVAGLGSGRARPPVEPCLDSSQLNGSRGRTGARALCGPSPTALRNRAILTLLARLGLRAHEIVSLSLDDINWQEAHLIIRAGKTHHERVLPLLHRRGDPGGVSLLGTSGHHQSSRLPPLQGALPTVFRFLLDQLPSSPCSRAGRGDPVRSTRRPCVSP